MKKSANYSRWQKNYIKTSNKDLVEHLRRNGIRAIRLPKKRYYESFDNDKLPLVDDEQMYLVGLYPRCIDAIRNFLGIPEDAELTINHKYKDDDEVIVDEFKKLGYDVTPFEMEVDDDESYNW